MTVNSYKMADKSTESDLFKAIREGVVSRLKQLTKSSEDELKCQDNEGNTLLHAAAEKGNVDMFVYLTSQGLDPFVVNNTGETVLHRAFISEKYSMISYLCQTFPSLLSQRDKVQYTPLHSCCYYSDNIRIFKYIQNQELDVYSLTGRGNTVLHTACHGGRDAIVQYLIQSYPSLKEYVNNFGHTALHAAAQGGNVELFIWLEQQGLDVHALTNKGRTVLHQTCQFGTRDMVQYLVDKYPQMICKVDKYKYTALHHAAKRGNIELFELLVRKGLNVYNLDYQERTVLHLAAFYNRYRMVEYLVTKYPDLKEMRTANGESALVTAAKKKHDQIIKHLTNQGMDPWDSIDFLDDKMKFSKEALYPKIFFSAEGSDVDSGRHSYLGVRSPPASVGSAEDIAACNEIEEEEKWIRDWPAFLSPRLLRAHIKEKGNKSKETQRLLQWICSRVGASIINVQQVWPGYKVDKNTEPVFVALVNEKNVDNPKKFDTFQLHVRQNGQVSDEAKHVVKTEQERGLRFTDDESRALQTCLTKHTRDLMKKHANLSIVSASKIKSRKYGTEEGSIDEVTCIVFYVHVKGVIPFDEDPFPSELDGFPTDVREGIFYPYSNPCEYHQHLMMGCQIATAYGTCGTLGAFVELPNGNLGCLTSWHMFITDESKFDYQQHTVNHSHFKKTVYQPNGMDENFKFGRLHDASLDQGDADNIGVDAALIEITENQRQPQDGNFPQAVSNAAGFSTETPMMFISGKIVKSFPEVPKSCNVVKYGCKTGHTRGNLRLAGPAVNKQRFAYQVGSNPRDVLELHQQFEVEHVEGQPFSDFGDSGSLVFLVKDDGDGYDITALGLLVGGTSHNTTIVTPIWAVLQKFGLPLQLLPFGAVPNTGVQASTSESMRMDVLELDVSAMKLDMGALKLDMSSVKSDLTSVKSNVSNLKQDISLVKSDVTTVKSDVANLKQDVTSVKSTVTSVQADVNWLKTSITRMDSKIDQNFQSQMTEMRTLFQSFVMPKPKQTEKTAKDSDSDDV